MNLFLAMKTWGLLGLIRLVAVALGFSANGLAAQNPLTPEGRFLADPAVRMAADGTLYAIGSVDVDPNGYCSTRYAVLASRDHGLTWSWHPDVFSSVGEGDAGLSGSAGAPPDGVPYNDRVLFAPDWLPGPDGWTLYYCQPDRVNAEGVASATGPLGPFSGGQPLSTLGYPEIDPAVFRDDDGSVYYLWGQFSVKMARLQPDGRSLDSNTLVTDLLTEREHGFHEGVSMAKRNGLYYLVYAYMGRADRPTGLAWAWSKQPFGPYAFGGVLIDNDGCDPGTWNNHGCIAPLDASLDQTGERWAVFYHRSTQNSANMRKACAEPITFDAEGRIAEVPMTSQGLGPPLSANRRIDARLACLLQGDGRIGPLPAAGQDAPSDQLQPQGTSSLSLSGEGLIGMGHRDRAAFKYIAFGNDVDSVRLRVLSP
ncbi:MAG: family 43 glycosylhydrolase, partial [Bacteroidetes bacterium]|nr:family 43 glycosylhydrolase [Bacteroidota bacterium]